MTATAFTAVPNSVRLLENATNGILGTRYGQIAAYGNSNVSLSANEGWFDIGYQVAEIDTSGQCDEYVAAGGVPEVELGIRKTSHKKGFTAQYIYFEEFAEALARAATMVVNYPGSPVNTTVDTGSGSITSTTIPVAAGAGANYAINDLIEIVCGTSTYGTRSLFRRIKSIATDLITLEIPVSQVPANGAAVKKVESIDFVESIAEFPSLVQMRLLEQDNVNQAVNIEHFPKVQSKKGKYMSGMGKEPAKIELNLSALGEYDATYGYVVSKRRKVS